jgi:DNA (cytosine-5)-methyltransferase 1
MNTPYTAVSLFSGASGLDLGLERTGGFEVRAAVEQDPSACATIRAAHAAARLGGYGFRLYEADVAAPEPQRVLDDLGLRPGELDLLCGGPPCQPVSSVGRRGGTADHRGLLLWQFVWWLETTLPKAFLIENVHGLLSAPLRPGAPHGSLLREFLRDVPPQYRIDAFVVEAADHGAPQYRTRVLLVGNRLGRVATFPPATHGPPGSGLLPHRTLADALAELVDPQPVVLPFSEAKRRVLALVPPGGNWRSLPDAVAREAMGTAYLRKGGRTGWFRRLAWDRPCSTVLTLPNHASTSLCHPTKDRPLSVRECAAVQGFATDWPFHGSPVEQYRQVGNAVPVPLGEECGRAVADLLDGSGTDESAPRFQLIDTRLKKPKGEPHVDAR